MSEKNYDLDYALCVYSGISKTLDFEMKYGSEDKTEEFQYIVDRYRTECIVSGSYLADKLSEYKKYVKERYEEHDE